jgi:hypothetical protein
VYLLQQEVTDLATLQKRITLGKELVSVLRVLDPGFTPRMGRITKVLANDRICLLKMLKADGMKEEKKLMLNKSMEEVVITVLPAIE